MFDFSRTIRLVSNALFDSTATWQAYLPEAGDWKKTAALLTGPLIVASAVAAYLLGLITGGGIFRPTILSTIATIIMGAVGIGVLAFILGALSGTFGGKRDFALALAAATLAFVPGYVGQALMWLPWIGWLLGIGLGIFSLVQLWKVIPVYLEVPDNKRTLHYIISLLVTIIAMMLLSRIFAPLMPMPNSKFGDITSLSAPSGDSSGSVLGSMSQQVAIIAGAQEDSFTPPANDELTDGQVREYASIMKSVAGRRADAMKHMQALAEKADEDDKLSARDLGAMMAGVSEAGALGTAEVGAVKAAGGNWAEHLWVREALWTARTQRQGSEAIEHNFALYQKYADELEQYADN